MDNVVRKKEYDWLLSVINNWRDGKGAVVSLQAESGFGKTFLLTTLQQELQSVKSTTDSAVIYVECTPPISSVVKSSIQPLQPFGNAIEQLYMNSAEAAKKRFALNVGLSLVSALPFIGDVLYAVKAVSQDITEYKRETAAMQQKKRSAVDECVRSLIEIAQTTPLLLLVDDAHYCDSQSVEVLKKISPLIGDVPLLIIWAITPSITQRSNQTLLHLLREQYFSTKTCILPELQKPELLHLLALYAKQHPISDSTRNLLVARAAGNASVLVEYIEYLLESKSLQSDGNVVPGTLEEISPSAAEHPATSVALHDLMEDQIDTLCLCAAEGKEFTAFMLAALTNTSIIHVIRNLRALSKSGLIKSIGMRTRYGIKTTVYEFTKSFTYTFFVHHLEYEERKSIHQRIAEILQAEYNKAVTDEQKFALSGIIAQHSLEAENEVLSEQMLTTSVAYTTRIGADEVSAYIQQNLLSAPDNSTELQLSSSEDSALEKSHEQAPINNSELTNWLANAMVAGRYTEVYTNVQMYVNTPRNMLALADHVQVVCLGAKAASALGNNTDAHQLLSVLQALHLPVASEVLLLNTQAMILLEQQDVNQALALLENAAKLCTTISSVERVLTLSNIYLVLQQTENPLQPTYEEALRTLTTQLGLARLRSDLHL